METALNTGWQLGDLNIAPGWARTPAEGGHEATDT
eukprot:CAMPEP_0174351938 /NCGR_PEP_ID=MMETSP0811_2-20130205/9461_1 /TAXON_ID=73025 ORGANISM="Eutreptiella gymnastica-like, Strain CCMP1594" /NCGR_SAMPLE_ID=MMETSP0811_2 /ASSEMBLY_ACC=CAM_ASM_000667 /LENGTH=34 /DNA_ID= /DNA_START= /DNA_END= /DNA_ORIENTATION=